jgi:hypothetical protein
MIEFVLRSQALRVLVDLDLARSTPLIGPRCNRHLDPR